MASATCASELSSSCARSVLSSSNRVSPPNDDGKDTQSASISRTDAKDAEQDSRKMPCACGCSLTWNLLTSATIVHVVRQSVEVEASRQFCGVVPQDAGDLCSVLDRRTPALAATFILGRFAVSFPQS